MHSWISTNTPCLVLAPMEGVTDVSMRALMTERGGFGFCVSEFLRVSHELLPPKVYFEHLPEHSNGFMTQSSIPVQLQLLGGNEELMAASAQRACELGVQAIDINFGCPSPIVNRNDGGASLLRYPERIRSIVASIRMAVPTHIPVSAKLRLGWDSMDDIYRNAEQAVLGGASWLTIHARTKTQGYAPPAHWEYIAEVKKRFAIPVVANGDLWTREDFLRCQELTGCQHFMLGRGALADPSLVHIMAQELGLGQSECPTFDHSPENWLEIIRRFDQLSRPHANGKNYVVRRVKQWLKIAHNQKRAPFFDVVKTTSTLEDLLNRIEAFAGNRTAEP